jgi:hypothetical protein
MTTMQQMAEGQNNAHVIFNENAETISAVAIFGKNPATTIGLAWGYYGGLYVGNTVADGTVALTNNADNYVVVLRSTGVVSVSTSNTNSADPLYAALYKVTTASGVVTAILDRRMDTNGLLINALTDSDLSSIVTAARTVPRSTSGLVSGECFATDSDVTIETMAEGSTPSVYNDSGSAISLIQDTGMTVRLGGTTTTGTRTLAARGIASIWFNSATEAIVTGAGVS